MFAFQDRRSRPAALVALGIIALITVLYIKPVYEAIGGSTILWFYDLSIIVMAGFSAVLSLLLARSYGKREVLRTIWLLLGLGLGLWALGEAIWAYNELVVQSEELFPGPADIVWVLGYIPLFVAMYLRYKSLATVPERNRLIALIAIFAALVAVVSYYLLYPILTDPESTPLEIFISVLYPVGDLVVALGAILIFLVLTGGALSRPWMMIAAGFFILSIADMIFTYADWQEIYATGESINLVSALADVPYYAGYVIIGFGVYLQARLQKIL
jgi:hypothetical protein